MNLVAHLLIIHLDALVLRINWQQNWHAENISYPIYRFFFLKKLAIYGFSFEMLTPLNVQDKINGKVRVQTDSGEWIVGELLYLSHEVLWNSFITA